MGKTPNEEKLRKILGLSLAFSVVYGAVATYLYVRTRQDLAVYQQGALSLIAQKVDDADTNAQLQRMEELGLLDALNDPALGRGGR